MEDIALVLIITIGAILGILLNCLIGGVILRAACYFLGVKGPGLGRAMGIVFVVSLIGTVIDFIVGPIAGMALDLEQGALGTRITLHGIAIVINMPIAAGIYTGKIPGVSFGKGLAIYWVQVLIGIVIAAIIGVPFVLLGFLGR